MANKAFLTLIEKLYQCRLFGMKKLRNVYLLYTSRGNLIAKGYDDVERALWVTHLATTLEERGLTQTVRYVPAVDGRKVIPFDHQFFTIMQEIEGKEADYASLYEVEKAVTTLAQFHLAARGIQPVPIEYGYKPPLLEKWHHRMNEFSRIVSSIRRKKPQNRLDALILAMAPEVEDNARQVMEQLNHKLLVKEMHEMLHQGTLAHRDVASHNFLLTKRGDCFLIDLDTVYFDMQLVDLIQFLSRVMMLQQYNPAVFSHIIEVYQRTNSLSDEQVKLVAELVRFPDNVLREVTGVYYRRSGYYARPVLQLLTYEYRLREARRMLLKQCEKWSIVA